MPLLYQHVCTNCRRHFEIPSAVEIRRSVGRAARFIPYRHLRIWAERTRARGGLGWQGLDELIRCLALLDPFYELRKEVIR